jgi:hypothetical protein
MYLIDMLEAVLAEEHSDSDYYSWDILQPVMGLPLIEPTCCLQDVAGGASHEHDWLDNMLQ